jgi:hypothetical protein
MGRRKGSKNKPKDQPKDQPKNQPKDRSENRQKNNKTEINTVKKRGRPKGSKNIVSEKCIDISIISNGKERTIAFKCDCGYELIQRQYKSKDVDDVQSSQTAVTYIQNGCPQCGKINEPLRHYLMKVNNRKPIVRDVIKNISTKPKLAKRKK